jgi:hypothetical protein
MYVHLYICRGGMCGGGVSYLKWRQIFPSPWILAAHGRPQIALFPVTYLFIFKTYFPKDKNFAYLKLWKNGNQVETRANSAVLNTRMEMLHNLCMCITDDTCFVANVVVSILFNWVCILACSI